MPAFNQRSSSARLPLINFKETFQALFKERRLLRAGAQFDLKFALTSDLYS